ncbi:MAG TPA: hypothetical protein DCS93_08380 [Microscillaceae bacterium]|nr:hypothetical protein [Microscillaceae bacterium]
MNTINSEYWETLTINAPAGFVVYFLKKQEHVKSAFGHLNIEVDNFRKLNDKVFSCRVKEASPEKNFLDNIRNSFFKQLPKKLPHISRNFIEIKYGK